MKKETIELQKGEKKGLYTLLLLFVICWGGIISPYKYISLFSWVALGLIGFSLWRIIEGLVDRNIKKEVN